MCNLVRYAPITTFGWGRKLIGPTDARRHREERRDMASLANVILTTSKLTRAREIETGR